MSALLTYERQPGTHELAERAGYTLYACPMHALLTEIGCNANRARLRAALKARDEIELISVRECRGCPGILALARGRRHRASRQTDDVVTAVQAAAMLGWASAGNAATRLHMAGVAPISTQKANTPINRARRNLYAREDVERLIAKRSAPRTPAPKSNRARAQSKGMRA